MTKDYTNYTIEDLINKAKVYIPNTENLQSLMGFISTSAPMANFVNA